MHGLSDSDEDDDLDEEEAACLPPMPVIDSRSVKLRSGRRAVQRVCFGFDDDFEEYNP